MVTGIPFLKYGLYRYSSYSLVLVNLMHIVVLGKSRGVELSWLHVDMTKCDEVIMSSSPNSST